MLGCLLLHGIEHDSLTLLLADGLLHVSQCAGGLVAWCVGLVGFLAAWLCDGLLHD
jgi:hypothetical protein